MRQDCSLTQPSLPCAVLSVGLPQAGDQGGVPGGAEGGAAAGRRVARLARVPCHGTVRACLRGDAVCFDV